MKKYITYISATLLIIITGCEIKQKDYNPESDFVKIYNDSDALKKYFPTGIAELDDGYLIVTAVKYEDDEDIEYPETEVFKTDKKGKLEWRQAYENFRGPANGIVHSAQYSGFIAMNSNLNGFFVSIDLSSGEELQRYDLDLKYPLSVHYNEENLVVLGYDSDERQSTVNMYDITNINLIKSNSLNINSDVEASIQEHMNKLGDQLPFFVGEWNDNGNTAFFANCYDNYSLRMVLFNKDLSKTNDLFVFQSKGAISSFLQKGKNEFALSLYYNNDNFIHPDTTISGSGSTQFNKTMGLHLEELTEKAKIFSNLHVDGNDTSLVFISSTNKNSILAYQFEPRGGKLIRKVESQFNEDIEISYGIQTEDMGYAILARILVDGKYARPVVIKLPPQRFRDED